MTTTRKRLSPHDRRMQLLDCTRTIVMDQGLSSFTMEALARKAGVSNPLIYKYFDTRRGVLQELLVRETARFNREMEAKAAEAKDYEALVTLVVAANFEQFSSNNIINILRDQPDIYAVVAANEPKQRKAMGQFLVKTLAHEFTVDRKQAEQIILLASGASQAAAAQYNRFGGHKATMINQAVRFIFGGIEALLPH
jgi:AcrR family transcriptional regulator